MLPFLIGEEADGLSVENGKFTIHRGEARRVVSGLGGIGPAAKTAIPILLAECERLRSERGRSWLSVNRLSGKFKMKLDCLIQSLRSIDSARYPERESVLSNRLNSSIH